MKATTIIYQVIFASLLLVGCTKVDLCDEGTHPHVVEGFSVTYNWKDLDLSDADTPERMYFVATRILNTRHMVYRTDKDGKFWVEKSEEEEKEPETNPDDSSSETPDNGDDPVTREDNATETPDDDNTEPGGEYQPDIKLPGGEYFMMAFTDPRYPKLTEYKEKLDEAGEVMKDKDGNPMIDIIKKEDDRVELVNLDEFTADEAMPVKQIIMRHATVEQKDVSKELVDNRKWADLNPGIAYVKDAGRKMLVARRDYVELDAGENYIQPFDFSSLTQHVEIRFTVQLLADENGNQLAEDDIRDIYIEMAGIAPEVSLSTGILNIAELKRVIVKVTDKNISQSTEDGKPVVNFSCTASLEVFGLIGGVDSYTIAGPGVCCIVLYPTDDNKTPLRAKANLSKQIKEQEITVETGKLNERKKTKDKVILTVGIPFRIVGENPEKGSDGIEGWTPADDDIHEDI